MLESFRVAKFRFTVSAKDHIRFPPYKGAAFRGGFGYTFKRVVCVIKGKACDDCLLKQKCIYSYIFETPPPEDTEILRLYPKVPHPFVTEPPITEKQSFEPGEEFSFQLILIGKSIDYLPYFIYTFAELGKQGIGQGRGKYDLLQVEGIGFGDETVPIYNNKDQKLTNDYPIITLQDCSQTGANHEAHEEREENTCGGKSRGNGPCIPPAMPTTLTGFKTLSGLARGNSLCIPTAMSTPYEGKDKEGIKKTATMSSCKWGNETLKVDNHTNHLTILLLTPLRLRFDGRITDKLEFHVLIRNLLRRISSLSYFHCGKKFDVNFKELIENARGIKIIKSDTHWYDWKRYSTRQEEWMSLGGVTGTVSYEGDLSEFIPLLRLGEYVHVGKGTSFGLGKYKIL